MEIKLPFRECWESPGRWGQGKGGPLLTSQCWWRKEWANVGLEKLKCHVPRQGETMLWSILESSGIFHEQNIAFSQCFVFLWCSNVVTKDLSCKVPKRQCFPWQSPGWGEGWALHTIGATASPAPGCGVCPENLGLGAQGMAAEAMGSCEKSALQKWLDWSFPGVCLHD